MALRLLKNVRGYDADYWKITRINATFDGKAEVTLALFKNRNLSASSQNAMDVRTVVIPFDQFKGLLNKLYSDVKAALEEMMLAEDIIEADPNLPATK